MYAALIKGLRISQSKCTPKYTPNFIFNPLLTHPSIQPAEPSTQFCSRAAGGLSFRNFADTCAWNATVRLGASAQICALHLRRCRLPITWAAGRSENTGSAGWGFRDFKSHHLKAR